MSFSLKSLAFTGWRYALAAVVVVVAGYLYLGRDGSLGATLTIVTGDFREQVSVSGTVIAARDVALGFAASGRIAGTYAAVGQHVWAGAVLAQIENGDLAAALSQKRSALKEAEAKLMSLREGTRPEEVAVAQAAVENAQAALENAVRNAYTVSDDAVHNKVDAFFINARTSNPKLAFMVANAPLVTTVERDRAAMEPALAEWALLVSRLNSANVADSARQTQTYIAQVSTLLVDANAAVNQGLADSTTSTATLSSYASSIAIGRTNLNTAATTLTADANALDSALKNLTLTQAGATLSAVAAQEAAVASAQADVQNALAALAKTLVVAPFSGIVTRMDAKVGEVVSPTASEISMQSDGIFQIETFIPEVAIARVAPGNMATTTLDAYGSAIAFPSKVVAVDPAETVKDGVPTYKTTLTFLVADARIRSGMTANVVMETGILHDAIVIPAGAVGHANGESYVSAVDDDAVVARTVTTGPSPALGQVQILSGLFAGDVILLAPAP